MNPPHDALAALASPAVQKEAAELAHDGFARIFRLIAEGDEAAAELGLSIIESRARDWAGKDADGERATLRLALLISGLDQWGLAWSQAFDLAALPGLTRLLGNLRNPLDVEASARFEQQFAAIEACEENAIDFKMELRRGIHLALWHALAACETEAEQDTLIRKLGGLMLALMQGMPNWGGHLLADSIAHIQLRLLSAGTPDARAESATQRLLEALTRALPAERSKTIMAQAAQLVIAYQTAHRNAQHNADSASTEAGAR